MPHDVFLKMETVDGERSATQWLMGDGSARLADTHQTDSGYGNPSSFQITSQGGEPTAIDWFPAETIRPTESLFDL